MREQQAPKELCRTSSVSIPPAVRSRCLNAMLNLSREIREAADLRQEISSKFSPAPLPEPFLAGLKRTLTAEADIVRRNRNSSRSWRIWAPLAASCCVLLAALVFLLKGAPVTEGTVEEAEVSMLSINTPTLTAQGIVPVRVSIRRMYSEPVIMRANSAECGANCPSIRSCTDVLILENEENINFHIKPPSQMMTSHSNEVI